ncbi:hypothetical protein [Arthrobacter sp. GMC3]|uniref:LolA family protein n=1 Tax=Arthrobacter sp. GMC3 TaxID=2058894 RepID=UPI000CE454F4|nr:hypothetical protein [Arthrobacter sp. GMC3]
MSSRWLRWMPAAAMPVVVAAVVLAGPLQATAPVSLPAKTPEQVMALVAGSKVQALSGTVAETVDLGLPQLPAMGAGASSDSPSGAAMDQLLGLLTSPQTVRVYLDGATNQRVQLMNTLAEQDVVRHGNSVWTYNSATNTATSLTLPTTAPAPYATTPKLPGYVGPDTLPLASKAPMVPTPDSPVATPAQLAATILSNLDPSTDVSTGPSLSVAGRDAYQLLLTPRTSATLVGEVRIAVDAATGLPLSVSVQAKGSDGVALSVAFTSIDLTAPPASTFLFTPPPGATVTQMAVPARTSPLKTLPATPAGPQLPADPTTSGTGWATIVATPAGSVQASLLDSAALAQLLQDVPGGRVLETSLFTALVTTDGRLFVGAVPLAALQAAAASQ